MIRNVLIGFAALGMLPIANAGEIHIGFSDEFTEKLEDDYGVREGEFLTKRLRKDIEDAFGEDLSLLGDIHVTIEDAKPNRPTFEQLGSRPGLSFRSFGIGGAHVTARVEDTNGTEIVSLDYDWYETSIALAKGNATWSDANRAFDHFTRRLKKSTYKAKADLG